MNNWRIFDMNRQNVQIKPHVLPLKIYLGVGGFLIFLTLITVLIARMDLGPWNLAVAMSIAAFKATLVLLFFMHLKYDNKMYSVLFIISVLTLAVFIIFILFDTLRRGDINKVRTTYENKYAIIYDIDGKPVPLSDRLSLGNGATNYAKFYLEHGYGPIKEILTFNNIDSSMALEGSKLFDQTCANCHNLDSRHIGPPLRGVTSFRSNTFIMNMILNPEENIKKHPDIMALQKNYHTIMTYQYLNKDEARKILEYLRIEAGNNPGVKDGETKDNSK